MPQIYIDEKRNSVYFVTDCPICRVTSAVEIPTEAWDKYKAGAFIQEAWPDSTPSQREVVISGCHGRCFNALFPEEDDGL